MANKTYLFSAAKHAHDIEFHWNKMRNILSDMECGEIPMDSKKYDGISNLIESDTYRSLLNKIYSACCRPVIYLTGPEIGLAKEIVAWASEARAATCIKNGRYDLLKYC